MDGLPIGTRSFFVAHRWEGKPYRCPFAPTSLSVAIACYRSTCSWGCVAKEVGGEFPVPGFLRTLYSHFTWFQFRRGCSPGFPHHCFSLRFVVHGERFVHASYCLAGSGQAVAPCLIVFFPNLGEVSDTKIQTGCRPAYSRFRLF